jgi:hypothetical protein
MDILSDGERMGRPDTTQYPHDPRQTSARMRGTAG